MEKAKDNTRKITVHLNNGEKLIYYYTSQFGVKIVDDILNITVSEKTSIHIPLKSILYYEFKTLDAKS